MSVESIGAFGADGPPTAGLLGPDRRRAGRATMPYGGTDPEEEMREHDDEIVARLKRIEGQVSGIRKMYEGGRYCIDVLDQLAAARAGLDATALLILEDHVDSCVRAAIDSGEGQAKTEEMLGAVKRFVRSV